MKQIPTLSKPSLLEFSGQVLDDQVTGMFSGHIIQITNVPNAVWFDFSQANV